MDLRKLEIFVQVAKLNNFSKAAVELHMAQPAVSIAVRKLEETMNTRLFDRSARQVELTAEGRVLFEKAQVILRDVEDLTHSVNAMSTLQQGELTLACPSMLATYYLPNMLSGFLAEHPGLKASITQAGTKRVEEMLLQDEIEIGVTTSLPSPNNADLDIIPLVSEQMVLCVATNHPWSMRKTIDIAELDQSPMVVYESGYFIRSKLDELCAAKGVTPDFRMQTNFLPLLTKMVKEGLGSTVGIKVMADEEPGIVGIAIKPASRVNMALAKRRGRTISRANQAFLDWAEIKL
ncbi:MAG: DNA-binding transcriptional LysR family regulator [Halioglobus sp.]|jgi:LysR family cyn operon transcriptional activator